MDHHVTQWFAQNGLWLCKIWDFMHQWHTWVTLVKSIDWMAVWSQNVPSKSALCPRPMAYIQLWGDQVLWQQSCPLRIPPVYICVKDWHIYFGVSLSKASPSTGSPVLSNFSWYSWCLSCSINESTSSCGTQSSPTQKWWNGNLHTTKIHCSLHLFTWKNFDQTQGP